jgi:hypothetical protein
MLVLRAHGFEIKVMMIGELSTKKSAQLMIKTACNASTLIHARPSATYTNLIKTSRISPNLTRSMHAWRSRVGSRTMSVPMWWGRVLVHSQSWNRSAYVGVLVVAGAPPEELAMGAESGRNEWFESLADDVKAEADISEEGWRLGGTRR